MEEKLKTRRLEGNGEEGGTQEEAESEHRGSASVTKGSRQVLINFISCISYLMGFPINATIKDEAPVI